VIVIGITCIIASGIVGLSSIPLARVHKVVDGDTVHVKTLFLRRIRKVRMYGIDAPERNQNYGKESKDHLSKILTYNKLIILSHRGKDRDRDMVADIYTLPFFRSTSKRMVRAGMAHWYEQYARNDDDLESAQSKAKRKKRGLWKQKVITNPKDWRKR